MKNERQGSRRCFGTGPGMAEFKLSEIHPAEYNPRAISDEALMGLAVSLKKFGLVEPIIVNIKAGQNRIVGGHQRFKALMAIHGEHHKALCVTVSLDEKDEKLLNLTLNNPKVQGEFIEQLGAYIDLLRGTIGEGEYLDLKIDMLRAEFPDDEKAGKVLDDETPETPKKATTKTGQLWQLGNHRLLIGDSTNEKDVGRLFEDRRAALLSTDPPYCVDYTGKNRPGGGKDWSGTYNEIDIEAADDFYKIFFTNGLKYCINSAGIYLWFADKQRVMIENTCRILNLLIHQQIIWVKPCALMSFHIFAYQHECCLLMWQMGHKPKRRPNQSKPTGSVWFVGWQKEGDPTSPEYYTDVWQVDWEGAKRNSGKLHPTAKPVELFARPMRMHTKAGDICYEPFAGSGSQIIAAEKLDRVCLAIEKEPVFCDVIIERWENWTGKKAKLIK